MLKVAIACQGGGSHAAFAAGVLRALLGPNLRSKFDLVALSGTSGGAMCAALAWAGLVMGNHDGAIDRLTRFWRDLEVHDFLDAAANFWSVFLARMPVALEISPYAYEPVAAARMKELLSRHLAIEALPADPSRRARPKLFIGATDIGRGERTIFEGETLTYDDLIASAAIPPLYRAVHAHGRRFWDGLFTTNPPVHRRPAQRTLGQSFARPGALLRRQDKSAAQTACVARSPLQADLHPRRRIGHPGSGLSLEARSHRRVHRAADAQRRGTGRVVLPEAIAVAAQGDRSGCGGVS